jgi:hypothetical protein
VPIYGVRGNHDLVFAYNTMSNIKYLEMLKDPVEVKGLRIAGAPNVGETQAFLYKEFAKDVEMEQHAPVEQIAEFLAQNGDAEDLKEFYANNPVYQRMKDQEFDMLLTHQGLDEFAGSHGCGIGLSKIVQMKKPLLVCSGHLHKKGLRNDEFGYYGAKTCERVAYVHHINTETKEIEQVEVFEKKYREAA